MCSASPWGSSQRVPLSWWMSWPLQDLASRDYLLTCLVSSELWHNITITGKKFPKSQPFKFFLNKYSINNTWYYYFKYKISTTLQCAAILWALDYKNSRFHKYEYSSWFQWPACSNYQPMMTSSNGNIFRVTGPCVGNSTVPVISPHKGQWRRALMFSLICVWINGWVNNREAGDLRRHRGHDDVSVLPVPVSINPKMNLMDPSPWLAAHALTGNTCFLRKFTAMTTFGQMTCKMSRQDTIHRSMNISCIFIDSNVHTY